MMRQGLVRGAVFCGKVRYDQVGLGTLGYGVVRGMVICGAFWLGEIRLGVVRYVNVWYGS